MPRSPATARSAGLALCFDGREPALHPAMAPTRAAPGEVLFRPSVVLIDARDRAAAAPGSAFRGVLGHRAVGSLDGGAAGLVLTAPHIVCAVCDLCRSGLSAHCRLRRTLGLAGRDGVLSQTVSLPATVARAVPAGVSPEAALFAPDVGRALLVARRAALASRAFVTVVGDGPLALITAQVLARENARVRVLGRIPGREEPCERWGVKHRPVDEAGRRGDQDLVIVCSDDPCDFEVASAQVRPRGVIAITPPAGSIEATPEALAACVRREATLLPADWGDIDEGLALLASGSPDTSRLISERLSLANAPRAFQPNPDRAALATLIDVPAPHPDA